MIPSVEQETPSTSGTCGSSSIFHAILSDLSSTSSDSDYEQRKDLPNTPSQRQKRMQIFSLFIIRIAVFIIK